MNPDHLSPTAAPRTASHLYKLVITPLMAAMAYILMLLEFPLIPSAPFLKMDFSEIPIIISTVLLGPIPGILAELIKNLLNFITKSSTGGVGELANFLIGTAYILPLGFFCRKRRTWKPVLCSCLCGILLMSAVGIIANMYLLIPLYGLEDPWPFLTTGVIPFNLIKGTILTALTLCLLKPIHALDRILRR